VCRVSTAEMGVLNTASLWRQIYMTKWVGMDIHEEWMKAKFQVMFLHVGLRVKQPRWGWGSRFE
jgi:hypothetical protein